MADDTTVIIDIVVEDNSSTDIQNITNNVVHLHQAVQREERQESSWQRALQRTRKIATDAAKAVAKVAATVVGVASAAGPAVTGLLAVGKALAVVGKAGARLTPLLAFIPAFVAGFGLIKTTLKLAGPGLAKAFEPVTRAFVDANGEATALTKNLRRVIGIDVGPAANAFVKLNLPAISTAMERIAYQTNLVVAGFMNWTNSSRGIESIKNISKATADFVERLAPHVVATATAFGDLAGRAADPAFKALGGIISGILDRLRAWANDTSVEDINAALKDLSGYGGRLKDAFAVVRDIGRWMGENAAKVKAFSDAAAVAAIGIGAATGNIPAIVLGAVSLIINHWNQLKAPFAEAAGWVKGLADAWQRDSNRIRIAESIMEALAVLRRAFADATKDIGPKWRQFVVQLKSAWQEWAPLLKIWWDTVGKVVFAFIGAALGTFVTNLVTTGSAVAFFVDKATEAFKWLVNVVLDTLGWIIRGAAAAFSWVPDIGPKLRLAAAAFENFKNDVNRALNGIDPIKTIRINAQVYVTGGNTAAGGVDQRTGNSRNAGLSGLTSWMRAAAAFAGDRGGTSRTGGPTQVTASVQNTIYLDGRPFRDYTQRTVAGAADRAEWRARNRRVAPV